MNGSKIIFEADISDHSLKLAIWYHPDAPGEPVLEIMRSGLSETCLRNATELRLLGEAIRLAGIQELQKQGVKV